MSARTLVRGLAPPLLLETYRRHTGRSLRFAGRPASWAEAVANSGGYADESIVDRVTRATREVVAGRAVAERDAFLLDEADPPFAVLSTLWRAAAIDGRRRLDVIDFGGSLGSTYRACRPQLGGLESLHWQIVEQPGFVAAGRREFATPELSFHESVVGLPAPRGARVLIASSVLQYLEDPVAALEQFETLDAAFLVIDRTPLTDAGDDRLCIQHVPRHLHAASYPCRIQSRARLRERLSVRWQIVSDHLCDEGERLTDDGLVFQYRGLIFQRRP